MPINLIVAMCKNKGIGMSNTMPWNLPKDLKYFQRLTIGNRNNAIIMGKNTWNSTGFLKTRDNLILTTSLQIDRVKNGHAIKSFQSMGKLSIFLSTARYDNTWVIGGAQIYEKFIHANVVDFIYLTYIDQVYECDTYFPDIPDNYLSYKYDECDETTENGEKTYRLIYKRLQTGMTVEYKDELWELVVVHFDDYPQCYFTIKNKEGREIQTVKSKLKLVL